MRWLQRTPAITAAEAKLKKNKRLALRRRMLQSGLSLWFGGVAIDIAFLVRDLLEATKWPMNGFGDALGPVGYWFLHTSALHSSY